MQKVLDTLDKMFASWRHPKTSKAIVNTAKMFKAIKESGSVVADVLGAFIGAGSAKDVFGDVVSSYADYLSDMFWGGVLGGIDFGALTTAITEGLGPVIETLGEVLGAVISEAPIGTTVGAAMGYLIYGPIGALIGGMVGFGIEFLYNYLTDIQGSLGTIGPSESPGAPEAMVRYYEETGLVPSGPMDVDYLNWWYETYILGGGAYPTAPGIPAGEFTIPTGGGHYAPELQHGTERVLRSGYKYIHRDESVTPSAYTGRTEALLQELLAETHRLRKEKQFRNMFKRR